jgi:glycosyltransferase involved in cell wall biosynthesis
MRLAYLYSRYPVVSQTFCDMEMLELERRGFDLLIGSVHSPLTSLRHEHLRRLKAPIYYAPPQSILKVWEKRAKADGSWPQALIDAHEEKYGAPFKAALRARNALYFADLFRREGVDHVHVHFANRAAHTAIFLKELSGIPFSITAHGQDFMSDLAQDDLLREICAATEFVAAETDYSRKLLQKRCPDSAAKIHRVYNGMDPANFPAAPPASDAAEPLLIVSVGRLVAFKGFENLIAACGLLRDKGLCFRCEIIGDGPLREKLQARIDEAELNSLVALRGSLTQAQVFESLQRCDVFALASIIDQAGASDVFPTVIQEAMACARPVVSTELAGIPETVIGGETGFLVSPGDVPGLADALEKLLRSRDLRSQLGEAGKARIEKHFRIETTIEPLLELFQSLDRKPAPPTQLKPDENKIAYLIDLWPDDRLPMLEKELLEMERRGVGMSAFVCRTSPEPRFTAAMEQLAPRLQFLPDAMAIEAEWRSNSELAHRLENDRASETDRAPADVFLQQARFALALEKLIRQKKISHLHATSSRALICGVMLKKMHDLSLSATIESQPVLSRGVIESALKHCVGGRTNDRELSERFGGRLIFEAGVLGIGLSRSDRFWREWSQLLVQWSGQTQTRE